MAQQTYTVQKGDTKTKLKQKFGLGFDFEGYQSQDPNKLFAGETISFDPDNYNIDSVKSASPLQIAVPEAPQLAQQNLVSQDPSRVGVNPNPQVQAQPTQAVQPAPAPASPLDGANTPNDGITQLSAEQTRLEKEISDATARIANLPTATIEAQKKLGIFEDQKQLEGLRENLSNVKNELLVAQDRGTELLEEGKQTISDFAGTDGDLGQLTNADLRKNNLNQLALSRTYSRLGDAVGNFQESINNSISIINQNAKAEQSKIEFEIAEKNKVLDRVISVQGNILSNAQKAKLEDVKFQNQLFLQDRTIQADHKKALLTELAKGGNLSGANLANFADMDLTDIMTELANTSPSSATAWLNYTPEEAAGRLDTEQYKRYQEYNKLDKAGREAAAKQEAIVSSTSETHSLINDILGNTGGLSDSVGSWAVGRTNFSALNNAEVKKFRADLVGLSSVITLDTLKNLKASGATLGAISEKELNILQTAGTRLGLLTDESGKITGRSNLSEKDFKTRLQEIQTSALKVNLLNDIGRENFDKYGLKDRDNQSLNDFYSAVQADQVDLGTGGGVENIKDFARVSTNIGVGTATGIESGSSANKFGFDLVIDGGQGAPVNSPFDGKIVKVVNNFTNNTGRPLPNGFDQNDGWGNQVQIELADGSRAWINHLASAQNFSIGESVKAGQLIGTQGNTGNTLGQTGVHVDITILDPNKNKLSSRQVADLMGTRKV